VRGKEKGNRKKNVVPDFKDLLIFVSIKQWEMSD
jgi:hypothetical protein